MFGVQAVVDHVAGAAAAFFGGLEEIDQGAGPGRGAGEERFDAAEHAGDVEVVAAGVHGGLFDVVEVSVHLGFGGGIVEACFLFETESVNVCSKEDSWTGAIAVDAYETCAANVGFDLDRRAMLLVQCFEFRDNARGCFFLKGTKLGVAVEVLVELFVRFEIG